MKGLGALLALLICVSEAQAQSDNSLELPSAPAAGGTAWNSGKITIDLLSYCLII